jgi:hypothetical protein
VPRQHLVRPILAHSRCGWFAVRSLPGSGGPSSLESCSPLRLGAALPSPTLSASSHQLQAASPLFFSLPISTHVGLSCSIQPHLTSSALLLCFLPLSTRVNIRARSRLCSLVLAGWPPRACVSTRDDCRSNLSDLWPQPFIPALSFCSTVEAIDTGYRSDEPTVFRLVYRERSGATRQQWHEWTETGRFVVIEDRPGVFLLDSDDLVTTWTSRRHFHTRVGGVQFCGLWEHNGRGWNLAAKNHNRLDL